MKKRLFVLLAASVLAFAGAVIFAALLFFGPNSKPHTAVITLDGKMVRMIDLNSASDEEFTLEGENGSNTVCIKNGEIYVSEASCPDKICVKHGALVSELSPIVCLPNRLVIELR